MNEDGPMGTSVIIRAENLEKIYGFGRSALRVLKGISLEIRAGEVISIVGPSGAGKSTLLNLIGCLDFFQNGSLTVMGNEVSNLSVEALSGFRNRHIGFIFQSHNLLPEFTALENIMIPLMIRRTGKKEARGRALALLERFGMTDRAHHKPSELSGGECQRVAVARAISRKAGHHPRGRADRESRPREFQNADRPAPGPGTPGGDHDRDRHPRQ